MVFVHDIDAIDPGSPVSTLDDFVWARDMAGAPGQQFGADWDGDGCAARVIQPERLTSASRPVLDRLGNELGSASVGVLLAGADGRVVDWRVGDLELKQQLGAMLSARELGIRDGGTDPSVIGVVLKCQAPSMMKRQERCAGVFAKLVCAGAPIMDSSTGQILGVLGVSGVGKDASPLMLAVATAAAREIEQHLADDGLSAERVLLDRFLQARRRVKGPLVCLNDRKMIANAAASRLLDPSDQEMLWDRASRSLDNGQPTVSAVSLAKGTSVAVMIEPITDGASVVGALLILDRLAPSGARRTFGWESLTEAERGVAELVAQGLSNREVATQLILSPHTVGAHLRQIFRKLDISSRVKLARIVTLQNPELRDT
jgi:DNA-binding CsgD family transcriptional regulator